MSLTLGEIRNRVRRGLSATVSQYGDEDIDADINEAISGAKADRLFIRVQDETLEQTADQYEYPLTGVDVLDYVVFVTDLYPESIETGIFESEPLSKMLWTIEGATIPYISFPTYNWYPDNGKKIRLIGMKEQPQVNTDDDVVYLPESYIVNKARAFGHNNLSSGAGGGRSSWHGQQVAIREQYAELARMSAFEYKIPPNSRIVTGRF